MPSEREYGVKIGDPVFAVQSFYPKSEDKVLNFYGMGVYLGDMRVPDEVEILGVSAKMMRDIMVERYENSEDMEHHPDFDSMEEEIEFVLDKNRRNPLILLNSGKFVWGHECWWGPPENLQKYKDACSRIQIVEPSDTQPQFRDQQEEFEFQSILKHEVKKIQNV